MDPINISVTISGGVATMEAAQFSSLMDTVMKLQSEQRDAMKTLRFKKQVEVEAAPMTNFDETVTEAKRLAHITGNTVKFTFTAKDVYFVSPDGKVTNQNA